MTETQTAVELTHGTLIDMFAQRAQEMADAGIPLALIGDALVTVGLRFEVAAYGPRAVTSRLATASLAMKRIAEEVDGQPVGSTATN